ncbi:uracil-DNA glycosylase [Sphingomonas montana]|uniref:uracil-DNA glycosylase n=1 Tax=Sphingomonas montana TaxID=1843236 RepID=UPI00096EBB29|nr:uracil-DNA glycosylase [Sphingomonas montana]
MYDISPIASAEWRAALGTAADPVTLAGVRAFLADEAAGGATVFPPAPEVFRALELTAPADVRVVILGQDPYHGAGQAHGLSFSVRPGVRVPPSLRNVYRELRDDLGVVPASHGHLEAWARQGVLLLNSVLTVAEGQAGAHRRKGWEPFTDAVIAAVDRGPPAVFLLWGKPAQEKAALVDERRHLVIRSVHPSGLSAHRGFFGSRPFSQANAFLAAQGRGTIDWALPAIP